MSSILVAVNFSLYFFALSVFSLKVLRSERMVSKKRFWGAMVILWGMMIICVFLSIFYLWARLFIQGGLFSCEKTKKLVEFK